MIQRIGMQLVRGFCMGAADIVPGVSGGTIALLFGIYERLVAQVRSGASFVAALARRDMAGARAAWRSVDWLWLISLLAGIGLAVVLLAGWLEHQIEERPALVSAVFFGLVAASVVVALRQLREPDSFRLAVLAISAVAAFVLLGLRGGTNDAPAWWLLVLAGSVAICAMILPGISGSFILLMFGLYDHVLHAIEERELSTIALFGVGAVVGILSFSTLLNWLLEHHHATVLAVLIGIMLGSLRVLWPWPTGEEGLENVGLGAPESSELVGCAVGAIIAFGAVMVLAEIVRRTEGEAAG